jgi:hypothetical protein
MIGGITSYNFESRKPKNDSAQIWLKLTLSGQKIFDKSMTMDTMWWQYWVANIDILGQGLGLWCLTPLSTIF